jgi:hypothetical protein
MELSVVLPCLNEAETVEVCVRKALRSMMDIGVVGEVIVADNGSTDGSQSLAVAAGARVVHIPTRGYGAALRGGIAAARGKYVLMADADDSYDLANLGPFVDKLREGYELVMGNRFRGGIDPGAMPFLHKLGNPVLSGVGKLFFGIPVDDFHCGIRAFDRHRVLELDLHTTGMEFASELVVQAALAGLKMTEVPTRLAKDGRSRPPHLRTWRDGWRHLRFLLLYSPGWLFFFPGYALVTSGLVGASITATGPHRLGNLVLDNGTLIVSCLAIMLGVQILLFWVLSNALTSTLGITVRTGKSARLIRSLTVERGVVAGAGLLAVGVLEVGLALFRWRHAGFGPLDAGRNVRLLLPGLTAAVLGLQFAFSSFLLGLTSIRTSRAVGPLYMDSPDTPVSNSEGLVIDLRDHAVSASDPQGSSPV